MKKKLNVIISLCFVIAFAVAAALCFVIPMLMSKNPPVEVSETVSVQYKSVDGYRAYYLVGKLRNKTENEIKIKNVGGIKVYFKGSDGVADSWLGEKPETIEYIYLQPGQEFDLEVGTYYFTGSGVSVSRVTVDVEGKTYTIVGSASAGLPGVLGFLFIICAVVALILTISFARQNKVSGKRAVALEGVCANLGGECAVLRGTLADKNESKKAAAKTAGWVFGAILTTIFTGTGVYKVYSGTTVMEFVLGKDALYVIKDSGANVSENSLVKVTREDYPVASIEVKKKNVVMKCSDNKQTITLFTDKKSALTAEQIAERLNDIFVKELPAPENEVFDEVSATNAADDPFGEFAPASAEGKAVDEGVVAADGNAPDADKKE